MSQTWKRGTWLAPLLLLGGCLHPVREQADAIVCEMAARPLDVHGPTQAETPKPVPPAADKKTTDDSQKPSDAVPKPIAGKSAPSAPPKDEFLKRLEMPPGLPGAKEEFKFPGPKAPEAERKKAIQDIYPPLPPLEAGPKPVPGPFGHPLTLTELQQMAMANSPLLRQAAADVEAARGAAKQAGEYPNPNFGYESDTAGTSGTAGFQGVFFEQLIKTAGKLKTAQSSALMSLLNAELALRRAQTDLMGQVRSGYFAVLVARQNTQWNEDLVDFTQRVYGVFLDQLRGGFLAGYEPLQLRAVTLQARSSLVQARSRYLSAWRQLAATLGLPEMPLSEMAGYAEMRIPAFAYEKALVHVLSRHTDILTARNTQQKARYDLHAAEITPYPDVDVRVAVQKDFSMTPFGITHSVQVGVPIPIWDRNQGAIRQAQAALLRATEEEHRVRDDLTSRLADAFDRYESNAELARRYRERVLPDLSLVYSRTVYRFATQTLSPDASLASLDVVTNQGLYLSAIATYAGALRDQWQAVADLSSLLQLDELFLGTTRTDEPVGEHVPPLPCSHPCNPLPGLAQSQCGSCLSAVLPGEVSRKSQLPAESLSAEPSTR